MIIKKSWMKLFLTILFLSLFFAFTYKLYIPRINAFGCFDDCFNFMGGYFINGGKAIYTSFFFNHQPGMAYISALLQWLLHPSSIAELILRHRQFMLIFSFLASILLVLRFGRYLIFYIVVYELAKFYIFGDRFLAEGIVGYLLVYLLAANLELLQKKINKTDLFTIPVIAWAIIFLREPYIPAALFLFGLYLFGILKKNKKNTALSLILFFVLTITTVLSFNVSDYYFNIFIANKQLLGDELTPAGIINKLFVSFFYPFYLIFSPEKWTLLRTLLASMSALYIIGFSYLLYSKKYKYLLIITATLFISNLRPNEASRTFYEAFHIIVWTQLFLFSLSFLINHIINKSRKISLTLIVISIIALLFFVTNKNYFAYDKVNTSDEFFTNYSPVMDTGTRIRDLSGKGDTLFVDGLDDMIIWEAKLPSSYKYLWYTSFMPNIPKYQKERLYMFEKYPPDFYYGKCLNTTVLQADFVSKFLTSNYIQLNPVNEKKCILINAKKIKSISGAQRETLKGTKYILP